MTRIYRGTSNVWVDEYVRANKPKTFLASGGGEFGVGSYFWLDDLPAAIMSAVQYNANERDWGVVMLEFEDDALHALAEKNAGYGSRVLEFKHERKSPFEGLGSKPGNFVVPKDYSHIASDKQQQANHTPAKPGAPPPRTFGKMQSSDFRAINADPVKYGLEGNKNELAWQYDLIIGLCAADYGDASLVQLKFANHGITFLNNTAVCKRSKVICGKKVTLAWKKVTAWKMKARDEIYDNYFKGKPANTLIDLDKLLGG